MKTILTEEINGKNIAIGFSEAAIDPEATKDIIRPILLESQEAAAVAVKKDEVNAKRKLAMDARVAAKTLTGEAKKLKDAEYRVLLEQVDRMMKDELQPLVQVFEAKNKELWNSDQVVFFEPKQGEFKLSKLEYEALILEEEKLSSNLALEFNPETKIGTVIPNLLGVIYWVDNAGTWERGVVSEIGVGLPVGAINEKDLTDLQKTAITDQLEIKRIAELTPAEKDTEKQEAINAVTVHSSYIRSQYEIEGQTSADALANSQAWLDAEITKIEAKYV